MSNKNRVGRLFKFNDIRTLNHWYTWRLGADFAENQVRFLYSKEEALRETIVMVVEDEHLWKPPPSFFSLPCVDNPDPNNEEDWVDLLDGTYVHRIKVICEEYVVYIAHEPDDSYNFANTLYEVK